jgi:hypothetical protein
MKLKQFQILAIGGFALALAACDTSDSGEVEEAGEASGEVLEGSISDDMIALGELQSTPPEMKVVPQAEASDAADGAEGEGAAPAEGGPEMVSQPVVQPLPGE